MAVPCAEVVVLHVGSGGFASMFSEPSSALISAIRDLERPIFTAGIALDALSIQDAEDAADTTDVVLGVLGLYGQINVRCVLETYLGPPARIECQFRQTILRENLGFPARTMSLVASLPTVPGFLPAKVEAPQRDWPHRYDAADHPAQLSRFQEWRLAGSA